MGELDILQLIDEKKPRSREQKAL